MPQAVMAQNVRHSGSICLDWGRARRQVGEFRAAVSATTLYPL